MTMFDMLLSEQHIFTVPLNSIHRWYYHVDEMRNFEDKLILYGMANFLPLQLSHIIGKWQKIHSNNNKKKKEKKKPTAEEIWHALLPLIAQFKLRKLMVNTEHRKKKKKTSHAKRHIVVLPIPLAITLCHLFVIVWRQPKDHIALSNHTNPWMYLMSWP